MARREAFSDQDWVDGPSRYPFAITPTDGVDLEKFPKALYVGQTGNVSVIALDNPSAVTLENVQAGSIIPIRCKEVRATGTTAGGIVGLA